MDTERYHVEGLNSGAEDYIGKPFSVDELTARVRAVLRRTMGTEERQRVIRVGELEIDLGRRLVIRKGELVNLTRLEWLLLMQLANNAGKAMTFNDLLGRIWGRGYLNDPSVPSCVDLPSTTQN